MEEYSEYLIPASLEEINIGRMRTKSILSNILKAFLESNLEIAKVKMDNFKRPLTAYNDLLRRVRKYNLPLKVILRKQKVYLIKLKQT
jgi:hypothetical protein